MTTDYYDMVRWCPVCMESTEWRDEDGALRCANETHEARLAWALAQAAVSDQLSAVSSQQSEDDNYG